MNISLDCIPCIVNSFLRLLKSGILPEDKKEPAMRRLLDYLSRADYHQSPSALGREMHRMIREVLKNPDPYKEIKEKVGMNKVAKIATTGDDAPGAVWETASDAFKELFLSADVVISKGQGNLEGLIDVQHNIYFLLVTKCDLIAQRVGARTGDFIVMQQNPKNVT